VPLGGQTGEKLRSIHRNEPLGGQTGEKRRSVQRNMPLGGQTGEKRRSVQRNPPLDGQLLPSEWKMLVDNRFVNFEETSNLLVVGIVVEVQGPRKFQFGI